jgi:hypothetical protein
LREIAVFRGSAHPALAAEICTHLTVPQRPVMLLGFANDCLEVQLQSNCRERDVFLIQPLVPPVQGASYPASRDDLVAYARDQDAALPVIEALLRIPDQDYGDSDAVIIEIIEV